MLQVGHLDELPRHRFTYGHLDGTWTYVATPDQEGLVARRAGCRRFVAAPGATPVPVHQHLGAEEVFVVLAGSGIAYEEGPDGPAAYRVAAGDLVVRRANHEAHAFVAGEDGLEAIAYGPSDAGRAEVFPRIGVLRMRQRWLEVDAGVHPWDREAALGAPAVPAPADERPRRYVHADAVAPRAADADVAVRALGEAAGAREVGVRRISVAAGAPDGPRRAHSSVERLVLVLAGDGRLEQEGDPVELRPGSVVCALAGTGEPWRLVAGAGGLELLDLSVLDASDLVHLPDAGELLVPSLGVAVPARALGR